ncbi:MAG: DUF1566 domain-containing protein [Syntrophus sp. (in: bacteria)]
MKRKSVVIVRTIVFCMLLLVLWLPGTGLAGEIARDGRFIAYDNGTVLDTSTNLIWAARDNGSDITWSKALSYCDNYRGGGYTDWRMPTQDELAGLYDKTKTYNADCGYGIHLTALIHLTCAWAWASDTRDTKAAILYFVDGSRYWVRMFFDCPYTRALPVRSGK